ncbi:PqiC family protein [Alishewanella tabrizica]|uniref:ABC-type transport auxiliary lipoprotein component domain-containing protein n=1 Tax=Alishewanella tabrizica TaxID=671278 RepID=A0ABQ2WT65_9ALTE|nr:ABC-type transport auxiliary lipoprotein family protein [Alishewanella tabrizica]GGW73128.1 hypothetical protein GCM10008111_31470 [Alishewanella tabrizica]
MRQGTAFLLLVLMASMALGLAGCSSTPASDIRYYQLAIPSPQPVHSSKLAAIGIAPVRVATYLNGSGLVLQQSAVEFSIARQHLWADALEQQLQRQLTEYLLQALPKQPLALLNTPGVRTLQLEIDRFYANDQGQAIISGRYSLSLLGAIETVPFSHAVKLEQDGYPAMVYALSVGWQRVLADIAQHLATQVQ